MSKCPLASNETVSPCVCTVKKNGLDLMCENTDHSHISRAMTILKGKNVVIYYLKLRHNTLPKMQGRVPILEIVLVKFSAENCNAKKFMFLGLDIRHLTIHNSNLTVLEEAALSSLGKGLTQLDLSQNSILQVPTASIKTLHALLILNLNHNNINSIHAKAFEGLDTLEILTLYANKITNIENNAFKGLEKKLRRLNLGGNLLEAIPTAPLAQLDTLRKLEIQENRITNISEGDFEGLSLLDYLSLAHNQLKHIPARAFANLGQLNSLELDGNYITHLDPDAFVGLDGKYTLNNKFKFKNIKFPTNCENIRIYISLTLRQYTILLYIIFFPTFSCFLPVFFYVTKSIHYKIHYV
ncbi:hypothetical protein B566_EDAN008794 [Ephemera danica]|nr:hypothetical protein B566_EDAN008794 [Ephemera danica]